MLNEVGKMIWRERRRRGWSQRELGRRAGVNGQYISLIELGRANVSLATTAVILRALGIRIRFEEVEHGRAVSGDIGGPADPGPGDVPDLGRGRCPGRGAEGEMK